MSGIPVHTSSPINPQKSPQATGDSLATSTAPPPAASNQPHSTPATSTLSSSTANRYVPAQPGATAVPTPTGASSSIQPTPTSATPAFPPTSTQQASPPPPQPGAVPVPPQTTVPPSTTSIPPPPPSANPPPLLPHQQEGRLVDPTAASRAQPPAAATTTTNVPQSRTVDLSHPPGYVQDSRTSFQDRPVDAYNLLQNLSETNGRRPVDGLLGGNPGDVGGGKGWLETASEWTKKAGEKLSDGHDEIWKRINNEK